VFDDENEHEITAGAVVTLTVQLHRENMSIVFNKEMNGTTHDEEINEEQIDEKEKVQKKKIFFCYFIFINNKYFYITNRQLKYQKQLQIRHQKSGIINPIRKKRQIKIKEKRKDNQNQTTLHLINNP